MTNPVFIKYSYVLNGSTINDSFIEANHESYEIIDWETYIENNIVLIALEFINIDKIVKLY